MIAKPADEPALPAAGRLRVLVVDDNPDAADTLAVLISLWGHQALAVHNAEAALTVATGFRPHCLVMDIAMPGMDGYDLAREIRRRPAHNQARLVALSAFSNDTHQCRVREAGFDHYMTKPADPSELERLLRMLAQTLKLAERTKELAERNQELAQETKELLLEVKDELHDVKEELRDMKTELQELKADQSSA